MNKKIVLLGGGSLYFAGLLADLASRKKLRGSRIFLYDIDFERAQLIAKCGQRLSTEAGAALEIRATKDVREAIEGADFAIANIGGIGGGRRRLL